MNSAKTIMSPPSRSLLRPSNNERLPAAQTFVGRILPILDSQKAPPPPSAVAAKALIRCAMLGDGGGGEIGRDALKETVQRELACIFLLNRSYCIVYRYLGFDTFLYRAS